MHLSMEPTILWLSTLSAGCPLLPFKDVRLTGIILVNPVSSDTTRVEEKSM